MAVPATHINKLHYQQKLTTPDEAVRLVESNTRVRYSEFVMFPDLLDEALAKRVNELENVDISGTCFSKVPKVALADPSREHFYLTDCHFGVVARKLHDKDLCNYVPLTYHEAPRWARKYWDIDAALLLVGPMDSKGYFNLGVSNSVTPAVISKARKIVVEVNDKVPTCLGGNQESIHISQVDAIVEGNNNPLLEIPTPEPTATDVKIAEWIMKEIVDGACIQLGIGAFPMW